jgi:hypothetical protein
MQLNARSTMQNLPNPPAGRMTSSSSPPTLLTLYPLSQFSLPGAFIAIANEAPTISQMTFGKKKPEYAKANTLALEADWSR